MDKDQIKKSNDNIDNMISEYGYAIVGVLGNNMVCYTVGLTPILGYELVVSLPANPRVIHIIMNGFIAKQKENNDVSGIKYPAVFKDGTTLRGKLEDVSDEIDILNVITVRRCEVNKVYQLYLADENNLLPGEAGYNYEKMKQSVFN